MIPITEKLDKYDTLAAIAKDAGGKFKSPKAADDNIISAFYSIYYQGSCLMDLYLSFLDSVSIRQVEKMRFRFEITLYHPDGDSNAEPGVKLFMDKVYSKFPKLFKNPATQSKDATERFIRKDEKKTDGTVATILDQAVYLDTDELITAALEFHKLLTRTFPENGEYISKNCFGPKSAKYSHKPTSARVNLKRR